jgi:hypothetical protein
MITQEFERLIKDGFVKCLDLSMTERFPQQGLTVKELSSVPEVEGDEAVVLTISSHLFRILIFLHYKNDEQLKKILLQALNEKQTNLEQSKVYDYLCEVGNVFCGALKREVQKAVASLGMSTPNILSREAINYVQETRIDLQGFAGVSKQGSPTFYASYYLSAYGDLEYSSDSTVIEDEVDSGELEFF